jgi:hypothetical protein
MGKQYQSADAFKKALEAQLRARAAERNVPFSTLQLKFTIERLLARLFFREAPPWLLKGGFALDLRFHPRARTTKDVDLSVSEHTAAEQPDGATLREQLQDAAAHDAGDHLQFRIGEPKKELTNAPGGGSRFPCEALFLGKLYAAFHIDIGIGDALVGPPERLVGDDILNFAGVDPAIVLAIPKAQQFAEKLHAYTFPWSGRLNTRTKDLVDLVLLLERALLDPAEVRAALTATFHTRKTHTIPSPLPEGWAKDFRQWPERPVYQPPTCRKLFGTRTVLGRTRPRTIAGVTPNQNDADALGVIFSPVRSRRTSSDTLFGFYRWGLKG